MAWLNFIGGLLGLLGGADLAVRGSLGLAQKWGWPSWLAGMILLALGTSLPEMFVSLSAVQEHPELSLGNVFGSNVFNIGLVFGCALCFAGPSGLSVSARRTPGTRTVVYAATVIWLFAALGLELSVWLGCLALAALVWVMVRAVRQGGKEEELPAEGSQSLLRCWVYTLAGFALLAVGSQFFLEGALSFAGTMGWEDGLAGYLIAAAGTSAPELFTCVRAVRQGQGGAVYGNVLGSNLFNLLIVGGGCMVVAGGIEASENLVHQASLHLGAILVLFLLWTLRGFTSIHRRYGPWLIGGYILAAWWLQQL